MPIYTKSIGASGYSGINPIIYGDEVLAQNTFTPSNDTWLISGDFTFDEFGGLYSEGVGEYGDIDQELADFLIPLQESTYIFEWTTTLLTGSVYYEIYFGNDVVISGNIQSGTFNFEVELTGVETYLYIYFEGAGTARINNMSLKTIAAAPIGNSGFSGEDVSLTKCNQILPITEENFITYFNNLLVSLKLNGWMETE